MGQDLLAFVFFAKRVKSILIAMILTRSLATFAKAKRLPNSRAVFDSRLPAQR